MDPRLHLRQHYRPARRLVPGFLYRVWSWL
jgi:hypothetical protein